MVIEQHALQDPSEISHSFFLLAGKVHNALVYTPCGKYVVYPLGSFVVLKNLSTEKEAFFDGHTSEISCLSVSNDGNRLASGQINLMGVKVCVFII